MNPIDNNTNITFARSGKAGLANFITAMTKADALAPIIALECTVTGGRTIQAYKRGGKEEARERIIEETTGAIVWLWGVKVLNEWGDKILSKYLGTPGTNFDVGTDKVLRTPFKNYMKNGIKKPNITPNKVAALKFCKVATSILIANLFIGFVVPRLNHYLTKVILHDQKEKELAAGAGVNGTANSNVASYNANNGVQQTDATKENQKNKEGTAFKGSGVAALNVFTNAIENTNTGKLLSTDFGVAGGRMINARTKEERNEIAFRDLGSIYFYMWASGHVGNVLNLIENGRATRLNPSTAEIVDHYLQELMKKNGGELSVDEFRKLAQGAEDSAIKLPEGIKFEEGKLSLFEKLGNMLRKKQTEPLKVAKVSELEGKFDKAIMDRIRAMSKLQPLREGVAVVTKQQIIDAMNVAEINNPDMLSNVFSQFTGGKAKEIGKNAKGKVIYSKFEYLNGASTDPYKYVSNNKLYKLKSQIRDYINDICKMSKDGKVNKELLEKVKNKNITYSGINFAAGFAFAALFLSTLIPKMQYLITRKKTGLNVFPGTYDYEHNRKMEVD